MAVTGLHGANAFALGANHSCSEYIGGVFCWGANESGQLGNGTTVDSNVPVLTYGMLYSVAGGDNHTCAVHELGGVYCWGGNQSGQLGDGTNTDRLRPGFVPGLS